MKRNPQPHQFHQPGRQCAVGLQRRLERAQRACYFRAVPEYRGHAEIDPVALAEIIHWH